MHADVTDSQLETAERNLCRLHVSPQGRPVRLPDIEPPYAVTLVDDINSCAGAMQTE